jgi:hypothetical protein
MKHAIYLTIIAALLVALYERDNKATAYQNILSETSKHINALETNKSVLLGMIEQHG